VRETSDLPNDHRFLDDEFDGEARRPLKSDIAEIVAAFTKRTKARIDAVSAQWDAVEEVESPADVNEIVRSPGNEEEERKTPLES
jgi:hypothetical protein